MNTNKNKETTLKENMVSEIAKNKQEKKLNNKKFPVVGIGASAGGLGALEAFFKKIPENSGMAFVVIQHLDPNHIGMMPELLQRTTALKVSEAHDLLTVMPDCVYVIPPNKSMSIVNGMLHLFDPVESPGLRLPINIFFRSLAADREEKSIGIILSGMGSDGSLGVKAIKEKNGIVLVQDPVTAQFDSMPLNAINAVLVDGIAAPEDLPAKLIDIFQFMQDVTEPEIENKDNSSLEKILLLLHEQSGHDFSLYKKSTLFRRIERHKSLHQIEKTQNYVRFLQENPKAVEALFKDLLIGVTSFFRDKAVWEKLKESILPDMINQSPGGHLLRAWIPGCSTGEEAYSLAIIFKETLEKLKKRKNLQLQIFATDIDQDAIESARKGVFSSNIKTDVSQERLSRFFTPDGDGYRVNTIIREMVVFAPQNVIKDPPFTKIDLLSCRNLLIYMEAELQKKLMALFHYSLNPGGVMILGSAETPGNQVEGFEELDPRLKLYKRTLTPTPAELIDFPLAFSRTDRISSKTSTASKTIENIPVLTNQILLERFAPASVLVNENGNILYITGRTGKYLEPVAGKANWNINAMAREGLREQLPTAFKKAMQNYEPAYLHNISIGANGERLLVDVSVQRLKGPDPIKGMILVVFTDMPAKTETLNIKTEKRKPGGRQHELEVKLQKSYEDLQSTREEMQSSQEELKSTNEELQSTNEELQSINEELTTSKEEMQSLNEELQMVNLELQSKVSDYAQANSDMKNLLNSTEIATLFLDKELNIRRYTDSVTSVIKLRNADIGRPFTDLVTNLQYPEMETHARRVIKTLRTAEATIPTNDERWFHVRIMPYITSDDRIDGLVITFFDISLTKKLEIELKNTNAELLTKEKALAVSEVRYRRLFESAKDGMLILDAETGKILDVNPFLMEMLGYSKQEFVEKKIWEIGCLKDIAANHDKFVELQNKEWVRYENLPLETADGHKINVEFISNAYLVSDVKVIQCIIRDITARKKTEEQPPVKT
jgi:two-component system CheB/CheR fusion protein